MKVFKLGCSFALLMLLALDQALVSLSEDEEDFDALLSEETVVKRGFVQFGQMTRIVLKRNPLDFNGYGCWCGLGGKGKPVDGIDRCCKSHDECYDQIKECKFDQLKYVTGYRFKVKKNKITCRRGLFQIKNCGKKLCKCDAKAVQCWKKNKYQNKYKRWSQKKC